jgi:hypothetical protein
MPRKEDIIFNVSLLDLGTSHLTFLAFDLGLTPTASLFSDFRLQQNYTTSCPGPSVYRWQIMKLLSLHVT